MLPEPGSPHPYAPPGPGGISASARRRRPISLHIGAFLWLAPWLGPLLAFLYSGYFEMIPMLIIMGLHAGILVVLVNFLPSAVTEVASMGVWGLVEVAALALIVRLYWAPRHDRMWLLPTGVLFVALVNTIFVFLVLSQMKTGF